MYSIDTLLQPAYDRKPGADYRPVIGITANYENIDATLRDRYYRQVIAAGGVPVIIPPVADTDVITGTLATLDAIIFSGGGDHNPLWYGEEPVPGLHSINAERDAAELLTVRLAYDRQLPMLGICRGIQTIATALGGHVAQDITATIKHSQDADRSEPTHSVQVAAGSILHAIYGDTLKSAAGNTLLVNSFHHQAIDNPGDRFRATAHSRDGIIEAIESTEYKNILGVQWHPEWLGESGLPLFQWLVERGRDFHNACALHSRLLTLDTHCDTPMFFDQGADFTRRDSRILVDYQKMCEGRQDATIMVAYLPQPKIGEKFSEQIARSLPPGATPVLDASSPFSYANSIFDHIEDLVRHSNGCMSIARTVADLYRDKRQGRKSIVLGIENALALQHDIRNVKHFAQRGIVYMTLCHNGDNDICDSARGCNTHGGVSEFGEHVIKEMNSHGILVDMSHAGEKSFCDALQISRHPIVCSHSNCRSLCDHPRNLTDDQLRAIAAKGGVAHTTFYHGFLQSAGEADILDGIRHLEHAIRIMGIDHVGIGTDFDGDGGVKGFRSSSDAIQFTLQLLRRRYSEEDIQKIWGGNWLRLMAQVQQAKRLNG